MLAWSEGTDNGIQRTKNHGYDVLVGGKLFTSYQDHPRILVKLNPNLSSTAAGRYQILSRFFDPYKKLLRLPDFSPKSQDSIAVQMIRERKALADVEAGKLAQAIAKCNNIWASLPGAPYGQHTHSYAALEAVFVRKGGTLYIEAHAPGKN